MSGANKAVSVILLIITLALFGYAGWRTGQGAAISDSLPLIIAGLVCCAALIAVGARKKKKN